MIENRISALEKRMDALEASLPKPMAPENHPMYRPSDSPPASEKFAALWEVFGDKIGEDGRRLWPINSDEDILHETHEKRFGGFGDPQIPLEAHTRLMRAGMILGLVPGQLARLKTILYGGNLQAVFPDVPGAYGNVFAVRLNVEDLLDNSNKGGDAAGRDAWAVKEIAKQLERARR